MNRAARRRTAAHARRLGARPGYLHRLIAAQDAIERGKAHHVIDRARCDVHDLQGRRVLLHPRDQLSSRSMVVAMSSSSTSEGKQER